MRHSAFRRDLQGRTALIWACYCEMEERVEVLVKGRDPDKLGLPAAEQRQKAIIEFLLERGAALEDRDEKGLTALHHAAQIVVSAAISYVAALFALHSRRISVIRRSIPALRKNSPAPPAQAEPRINAPVLRACMPLRASASSASAPARAACRSMA